MWKALPKDKQRNKTLHGKAYDIWLHAKDIDVKEAIKNLVQNQIEDAVIGRTIGRTKKALRETLGGRSQKGPLDAYAINGVLRASTF